MDFVTGGLALAGAVSVALIVYSIPSVTFPQMKGKGGWAVLIGSILGGIALVWLLAKKFGFGNVYGDGSVILQHALQHGGLISMGAYAMLVGLGLLTLVGGINTIRHGRAAM